MQQDAQPIPIFPRLPTPLAILPPLPTRRYFARVAYSSSVVRAGPRNKETLDLNNFNILTEASRTHQEL